MSSNQPYPAPNQSGLRDEFRQLMGLFATGVCVVAVEQDNGEIAAMTVNSFVSVSLEPRLISWNLQNAASRFDLFANAQQFSMSILSEEQIDVARRYAARGNTRFQPEDFSRDEHGQPVVVGSLGFLTCRQWSKVAAGDHTMILGEVIGLGPKCSNTNAEPLGFFNGQFCGIRS